MIIFIFSYPPYVLCKYSEKAAAHIRAAASLMNV